MKLFYIPPRRFPIWGKFNLSLLGKKRHAFANGEVSCSFDKDSIYPHYNHVEMSGFEASSIISYKVESSRVLKLYRFCVFPELRINPNNTHGGLTRAFAGVKIDDGGEVAEGMSFGGILTLNSKIGDLKINRQFIVSSERKALIEKIFLTNSGEKERVVKITNPKPTIKIAKSFTAFGKPFYLYTETFVAGKAEENKKFTVKLAKGEKKELVIVYGADRLSYDQIGESIYSRQKFLSATAKRMKMLTPVPDINVMAEFCKIRASESIFRTKNGLMHAPGGGGYYAALWTNDQCEYANPFFAYYGYDKAIEQSVNCYRLFSKLADEDKAILTSITACGDGFWHGAGDRGDSSMYIYGLSRYLLTVGDIELTREFIPSIEKALKYVIKKINENNVVESDADELEGRFESGKANLCTSCLTYDGFISLAYLYTELGREENAIELNCYAARIKEGIEKWFGANVEGYETYRYCEEESALRSWICLPMTVGITERKTETAKALLSDKLRTGNGILTRSGEKTYWDRSTLYTIKGLFCAGEADKAVELFSKYSTERLLGEHVPYPVEAFPEGNAAHLSAESALYLRIFTEGILGFRPVGFGKFTLAPSIPSGWDNFEIQGLIISGKSLDIKIKKTKGQAVLTINGKPAIGDILDIKNF